MRRSLASLIGLALVYLAAPYASSAQSSIRQDVTIVISPIVSLAVHAEGVGPDQVSLLYDLTTNARGAVLEASLRSFADSDAMVTVNAGTTFGISRGKVALRPVEPAVPLVTDIRPGLKNGQTISVLFDGEPIDATLALTLRDPASGLVQTVETRL